MSIVCIQDNPLLYEQNNRFINFFDVKYKSLKKVSQGKSIKEPLGISTANTLLVQHGYL